MSFLSSAWDGPRRRHRHVRSRTQHQHVEHAVLAVRVDHVVVTIEHAPHDLAQRSLERRGLRAVVGRAAVTQREAAGQSGEDLAAGGVVRLDPDGIPRTLYANVSTDGLAVK